jgi:homoserine dehydrogenase
LLDKPIRICLLGLGTVGTGVVTLLRQNAENITHKLGKRLVLTGILVRDPAKPRQVPIEPGLLTADPAILMDPGIDMVVEVMGGIDPAREYVLQALRGGKSVVTANKDLLANYGEELFAAVAQYGGALYFEGSVAGGIPIIRPLKECLAANCLQEVMGIINGTTNYILTRMTYQGDEFAKALAEAQALGYAEADPTADIAGDDAARKLAILASIAFNTRVTYADVYVEGITGVTARDITYAHELGYMVKLLGIAREDHGQVEVRVHPTFVRRDHPLAAVDDVYNAIFVRGDAVGEVMFYGRGAGAMPTASAVVGDIMAAAGALAGRLSGRVSTCTCYTQKPIRSMGEVSCKYYLRLTVKDRPGVLAGIAGVFGNQNVSIASVIQKRTTDENAEIVLVTHEVQEQNIQDALKIIGGLSTVGAVDSMIRVEDKQL